jgi:hypothetical protein
VNEKPPFVLVQRAVSHDTAEAARMIATDAQEGRSIGMATVVMYLKPEPHFIAFVTDEAERNPVFTSGMLNSLSFQLMQKANG